MNIEQPEDPPNFSEQAMLAIEEEARAVTIGQFYDSLDNFLKTLLGCTWHANRNQLTDDQFFAGQIFVVNRPVRIVTG